MRHFFRSKNSRAFAFVFCVTSAIFLSTETGRAQLKVDRATGALSFEASESAEVNGYSVTSGNGLLNPDAWSSLSDQEVEGWIEANPRNQQLSELNPFGFTDPAGSPLSMGNAYAGTTSPLRDEDLTLQYSLSDGTVVDGTVEYTGAINDLVLRVDPVSGAANLELLSGNVGPFDVLGYSIFSDSGSLVPANLSGLGDGWSAASPVPTAVAELSFEGSKVFTTNTTAGIGNVFMPGAEQDLRFEFATLDDVFQGSVTYEALGNVCNPNTGGDLDGNGTVEFADFLVLSANFGTSVADHTAGDIDCNGSVEFADFLVLSANFGQAVAAVSAVPEPSTGPAATLAVLLLAGTLRKRRRRQLATPEATEERLAVMGRLSFSQHAATQKTGYVATVAVVVLALLAATANDARAQVEFDTRMIVLDANNPGPNSQINNTREARDILRGFITDVNIAEDVTGTVELIDFAGGSGNLPFVNNPYPNGVNDDSLNDFTVQVTGFLEIPEGDWTIGFSTDDGGLISMPRVDFVATGNENGEDGTPGEIIYNGTRGVAWTYGHFTVPAGETLRTEFEAIQFERGGGDAFEVSHIDFHGEGADLSGGFEVGDDSFGWKVLETGPSPGDFNWDDTVDFADFLILADNFGTGSSFPQGDFNGDYRVDLHDFVQLFPLLSAPANAAAAVPEPSTAGLLSLAGMTLLLFARRRRHCR